MYYAIITDNKLNGKGQCPVSGENTFSVEIAQEVYNDFDRYMWNDTEIVLNPNYEEEQRQKEQERINQLTMTKADFWIALLDRDITKQMVKDKINLIPDEKLKAKTLIRLDDADHFWRGDASMNVVGAMFGITPQELNYLFENGKLPEVAE